MRPRAKHAEFSLVQDIFQISVELRGCIVGRELPERHSLVGKRQGILHGPGTARRIVDGLCTVHDPLKQLDELTLSMAGVRVVDLLFLQSGDSHDSVIRFVDRCGAGILREEVYPGRRGINLVLGACAANRQAVRTEIHTGGAVFTSWVRMNGKFLTRHRGQYALVGIEPVRRTVGDKCPTVGDVGFFNQAAGIGNHLFC